MSAQGTSFTIKQDSVPLRYAVSAPSVYSPETELWPVLCFLHGRKEAAPLDIREAVTKHGPLRPGSYWKATNQFIVVVPQLPPPGGDVWHRHGHAVRQIVAAVQEEYGGDPKQTYLTGFSFGGNGVFDIALAQQGFWAALWLVDPTRVPNDSLQCPVWLSLGQYSREKLDRFKEVLRFQPAANNLKGDFVYEDREKDHACTAKHAYQDSRVYDWLLSKHL